MRQRLIIGSRPSPLALRQVDEICVLFPRVKFEVRTYKTPGDRDQSTAISDVEGSDFFTRDLDEALLNGEIDLAVHSAKDLPEQIAPGLVIILETESISRYDCLVSRTGVGLMGLAKGSRVGTSSQRRKDQLRLKRPDFEIVDVRGNIGERLGLVESGKIDALIVAQAALIRLGIDPVITEILDLNEFPTHPKQGSLTLVAREDKCQKVKSILSAQAPVIRS